MEKPHFGHPEPPQEAPLDGPSSAQDRMLRRLGSSCRDDVEKMRDDVDHMCDVGSCSDDDVDHMCDVASCSDGEEGRK